jgi:hypothetical protein
LKDVVNSTALRRAAIASIICATITGVAVAGYVGYQAIRGVTKGDIEAEIRRELPLGATQDDIFAFLGDKDAEYERHARRAELYWALERRGVPPNAIVISAILRDTGLRFLPGETFIQIYFILDSDGRLESFYVEEGSSLI